MVRVRIIGGLGNQMFQYAAAKSLALKKGSDVIADVSAFKDYGVHPLALTQLNCQCQFEAKEGIISKLLYRPFILKLLAPFSKFLGIYQEKSLRFDPDFFAISPNTYLLGYFQTEKYFIDIRGVLIEEFQPKTPLSDKDSLIEADILESNSVSIHVRRGDYLSNQTANSVHGVCGKEYFSRAIDCLSDKGAINNSSKLFIFSDDIGWCKENLDFGLDMSFVESDQTRPEVDMYLMSKCRHNIISNSTYSWWGAWLNVNGDKCVVAPKNWFSSSELDSDDILPISWLMI